jgi:hypothetical protein
VGRVGEKRNEYRILERKSLGERPAARSTPVLVARNLRGFYERDGAVLIHYTTDQHSVAF